MHVRAFTLTFKTQPNTTNLLVNSIRKRANEHFAIFYAVRTNEFKFKSEIDKSLL